MNNPELPDYPQGGPAVNKIYQADCLEGMRHLPPGSVDMILSDLPYGVTANAWDLRIDLERLWAEYKRVIKPRGAIVLTARCPFDKLLGMSNFPWLRYEWIWEKSRATGFLDAKRVPLRAHENVLVFCDRSPPYSPQLEKGEPYRSTRKARFDANTGKHLRAAVTENPGFRYPRSVLHIASESNTIHHTQKPVALFEYLIRTYTKPGDLVLDSCMGSGTTAIACLNAGRYFIGFELDPECFKAAQQRIRNHRCSSNAGLTPPDETRSAGTAKTLPNGRLPDIDSLPQHEQLRSENNIGEADRNGSEIDNCQTSCGPTGP
ncbi:MAG TPA: site-specific DNA-methyltransferase [Candidatus Sulfotelmatobacter sp.]|jgi:site-specific DNA-methyltransferase (adenine-specific)|nr:site-specific DNA-methyltransferase [Candidatus Sulfotelmatobacter sp.]